MMETRCRERIPLKFTAFVLVLLTTLCMLSSASDAANEPLSQQPSTHQGAVTSIYEEDGDVLVLEQGNLDQAIKEFQLLMVNFYVSSNADSLLLEPEFSLTAEVLRTELPEVRFAKMATDRVNRKSMHRYRISADQPTVILFRDGHAVVYDQPLTSSNMAAWLRRKTGTVVTYVKDRETIDRIVRHEVIVVVGLFKGESRAEPLNYLRVAEKVEEEEEDARMRFLITDNIRIFTYLNVSSTDSAIVLLKKFNDGRSVLTENLTKDRIRKFLKTESTPSLILYTKATSSFIRNHEIESRLLLFISFTSDREANNDTFNEIAAAYAQASRLFSNKVLFVVFDVDEKEARKELGQFGSESECPLLVFVGQGKLRRSANSRLLRNKEDIQLFVHEVLDSKAQTTDEKLKTEPKTEL